MVEVAKKRTPLSEAELADVLRRAHEQALGSTPSYNRLALAWAQVLGETGRTQSMWNHNFGNIMCTSGWPECFRLQLPSTEPPLYRSYPTHEAGAADYWALLQRRYSSALERFDAGDAAGAARELRRKGYYQAPESQYATGLANGMAEFKRRFPRESAPLWRWLLGCVGLAASVGVAWWWR